MHKRFLTSKLQRLAVGTLGVLAALAAAQAGDRDTAVIELKANGADQRIEVDMNALAEGETRQLSAESGLPAIVTRTAEGLRVEIAGVVREIDMPKIDVLHTDALHLDDSAASHKRVVIKRAHAEGEQPGARHEVRVIRRSASEGDIDEAELDALVADALEEAGEGELSGEQVRVIRRVERQQHADSDG